MLILCYQSDTQVCFILSCHVSLLVMFLLQFLQLQSSSFLRAAWCFSASRCESEFRGSDMQNLTIYLVLWQTYLIQDVKHLEFYWNVSGRAF